MDEWFSSAYCSSYSYKPGRIALFFKFVTKIDISLKELDFLWTSLLCLCHVLTAKFFLCCLIKVIILAIIPRSFGLSTTADDAKNYLRVIILLQYVPRIIRFVPLLGGRQSATGFIFESAWANFVINLLMFVLAGHVVGSCWYLFGLQVSSFFIAIYRTIKLTSSVVFY